MDDPYSAAIASGMSPAAAAALPPGYIGRVFQVESGGNPNATAGSHVGPAQFGPAEQKQYGIADPTDPAQNARAVAAEAQTHGQILANRLGRPPTPGEIYLAHQQGAAGAPALLTAPEGTPAWQAIRPYYKTDAQARAAISGNLPKTSGLDPASVTAGDFSKFWVSRFEGGLPSFSSAAVPSTSAPVATQAPAPAAQPAPGPAMVGAPPDAAGTPSGLAALPGMLGQSEASVTPSQNIAPGPSLGAQYMKAAVDPHYALRQLLLKAIGPQQQPTGA
jgi:hypothetical protein